MFFTRGPSETIDACVTELKNKAQDCEFRQLHDYLTHDRIDPSVSAALKCKPDNQSVSFASSDQGLTTTQLCSIEICAIFPDFRNFQAGSVDFELIVVKH